MKRTGCVMVSSLVLALVMVAATGCAGGGEGLTEAEVELIQKLGLVLIEVAVPVLLAWGLQLYRGQLERARQWEDWHTVERTVNRAVQAAEQLGLTEDLQRYGESKLDAAITFVEAQLAAQGVPLDVEVYADAIRAMIEAEVKGINDNAPNHLGRWRGPEDEPAAWGDGGRLV